MDLALLHRRRHAVVAAALIGSVLAAFLGWKVLRTPDSAGAASTRLNLVVILADDERWDSSVRMTNVQRLLAAHGITFTNAFVTTSECCPSRASLLSGQYAHTTGVVQNFGPNSYPHFYERSNLAVWLRDAGYDTALIGKYLNDYTVYGNHHIPPGWSTWVAMDSVPEERYYDYTLNENGKLVHYGTRVPDYSTSVLGRKARAFVASAKEPFFLYFAPIAPHLPATPLPRDAKTVLTLQNPRPNFDERDISDKPWHAIYRRVAHCRPLRERQRVPLGGAPSRRENLALRGIDPRPARHPRPLEERLGDNERPVRSQHRLCLDPGRARGRQAASAAGRSQPRSALERQSPSLARVLRRRVPRRQPVLRRRPAPVPRPTDDPLALRRVPQRLA